MKILINTSNLYVGGGVQVALSFINELKEIIAAHEYHIYLSQAVDAQLDAETFPDNFRFYLIEKSPSSLKTRRVTVSEMERLEKHIKPDVVFSVFGPTYWIPSVIHIMGVANAWVFHRNSVAYKKLAFFSKMKMRLKVMVWSYHTKRDASYYVIETEDAKQKLSKVLGIDGSRIYVIGNCYSDLFNDPVYLSVNHAKYIKLPAKKDDEFRLLCISHNHLVKNIQIINQLLPLLEGSNVKFVLTLDQVSYSFLFGNGTKQIINLGPVEQKSCPSLYAQCDALFLPTLLETFSASYPEAMKMKMPILTSDLSFANHICQDAALYFDPLDANDIADKIMLLASDKHLQQELIEKGENRVKQFETARSRAEKYVALCENIVNLTREGGKGTSE